MWKKPLRSLGAFRATQPKSRKSTAQVIRQLRDERY